MSEKLDFCRCAGIDAGTRYFLESGKPSAPCKKCGKYSRLPNREERRAWRRKHKRLA